MGRGTEREETEKKPRNKFKVHKKIKITTKKKSMVVGVLAIGAQQNCGGGKLLSLSLVAWHGLSGRGGGSTGSRWEGEGKVEQ